MYPLGKTISVCCCVCCQVVNLQGWKAQFFSQRSDGLPLLWKRQVLLQVGDEFPGTWLQITHSSIENCAGKASSRRIWMGFGCEAVLSVSFAFLSGSNIGQWILVRCDYVFFSRIKLTHQKKRDKERDREREREGERERQLLVGAICVRAVFNFSSIKRKRPTWKSIKKTRKPPCF